MQRYTQPTLTLAEATEATRAWLKANGSDPRRVAEPVDGVVEVRSEKISTRLRWDRKPVSQAAILALLRHDDDYGAHVIFSVSGFTAGAVSLADSQSIALYIFDEEGAAEPANDLGAALQPARGTPRPFAPTPPPGEGDPNARPTPEDWTQCAACGVTHHGVLAACPSCRHERDAAGPGDADGFRPGSAGNGTASLLRCRDCGSHNVELVTIPTGTGTSPG